VSVVLPASLGRPTLSRDGAILPPTSLLGAPGPYVYDATSARRIPAVGRALQLYSGLVKQMPMDAYRGYQRLPQPRLLARPDPFRAGSWFVHVNVEDYLLSGNAISRVTVRGADGWPLAVEWLPATWTYVVWDPYAEESISYYYVGQKLPFDDVIHVRRGADRFYPVRGVGVVEEYLTTLDRVAMEEEYERQAWLDKFSGPVREPVILPNGTQVVPLAWSPSDTQLTEARHMSLTDVANIFNLDSYWLGAPVAGMTYRTAGPQYQQVLRTSLEPVLADFEDVWSDAWLPRGTNIRFRRSQLLREDLATSTTAAVAAYGAGIETLEEARVEIGLPPNMPAAIGVGSDMATPSGSPDMVSPDDPNADLPAGEPGGPQ